MTISFCIPYRGVNEFRRITFAYIQSKLAAEWPNEEVVVFDNGDEPLFSRSGSRNKAAAKARGDILVFLDADSYVSPTQVMSAISASRITGWCFPYDTYYALTPGGTQRFIDGDYPFNEADVWAVFPDPLKPEERPASVGGCVTVHREAFETVGGYDERFIGWSFEDRSFAYSLEAFYGATPRVKGPLYHLWHPAPEEECFGQPYMEANRALANRYRDAVGNQDLMHALVREHP
jgi:glycosyltransferase involved in cell wall biosynthesis